MTEPDRRDSMGEPVRRRPLDVVRDPEQSRPRVDERPRDPQKTFRRQDVYAKPVVDGRDVNDSGWARARAWLGGLLTSRAEREEAALEAKLRSHQRGVTRSNVIAVVSPKGGVGKTTCAFLIGNLLSSHVRLRTIVVDLNPDHGTLGLLAPDGMRTDKTLSDAIANLDEISSAPELRPYVSVLPSGLHLMGAPADPNIMKTMTPELYGQLTAFLGRFYDVVLLDLGTGVTDDIAESAIQRADQTVVVTTPEWATASVVLNAMRYLAAGEKGTEHMTLVLNKTVRRGNDATQQRIEAEFRKQHLRRRVTIPADERLKTMLDSGTYTLEILKRPSRSPIKDLGLAVASQLV